MQKDITSAVGGFYVQHNGSEWVVWGPMGDMQKTFVGKYSGHTTSEAAWAEARKRRNERLIYEERYTGPSPWTKDLPRGRVASDTLYEAPREVGDTEV